VGTLRIVLSDRQSAAPAVDGYSSPLLSGLSVLIVSSQGIILSFVSLKGFGRVRTSSPGIVSPGREEHAIPLSPVAAAGTVWVIIGLRKKVRLKKRVSERVCEAVDRIWGREVGGTHAARSSIHGFSHWVKVERNGLYIARLTGVSQAVVSLFSLFHDCLRENDGRDPDHGPRAAKLVVSMRTDLPFLNDEDFERLRYSCEHHTHRIHHEDPVVAACWDADRLELGRVEIEPDPDYFNTVPAIDLVKSGSLQELESLPLRRR